MTRTNKILILGDSGFVGSWLILYLNSFHKYQLYGISKFDKEKHKFHSEILKKIKYKNYRIDINNQKRLEEKILEISPDIIIHLAAEPLVLRSFKDPLSVYKTNLNGTMNIYEIALKIKNLKKVITFTTDKVYKNLNKKSIKYSEDDMLGGNCPYSLSKVLVEEASKYYRSIFLKKKVSLTIIRAGNIIGGGDFNNTRIIPDLMDHFFNKKKIIIRNINAIRPWQYVISSCDGIYKIICTNKSKLLLQNKYYEFNLGPKHNKKNVFSLISEINKHLPIPKIINQIKDNKKILSKKESLFLDLNSSKAVHTLKWKNQISLKEIIFQTTKWYKSFYSNKDIVEISNELIYEYKKKN